MPHYVYLCPNIPHFPNVPHFYKCIFVPQCAPLLQIYIHVPLCPTSQMCPILTTVKFCPQCTPLLQMYICAPMCPTFTNVYLCPNVPSFHNVPQLMYLLFLKCTYFYLLLLVPTFTGVPTFSKMYLFVPTFTCTYFY